MKQKLPALFALTFATAGSLALYEAGVPDATDSMLHAGQVSASELVPSPKVLEPTALSALTDEELQQPGS